MSLKVKSLILCLVILLTSLFVFTAKADILPSAINADIVPPNPAAGESVSINLSSYAVNLDAVPILWYVNGVLSNSANNGTGKKTFSINAPKIGSSTTVRAVITSPDGRIEKSIIIKPSVMVMLWQATDSYVPPFYRGKALPTSDSSIKVVAMPELRSGAGTISSKNLIYEWKKNYTNDAAASGYGNSSYTYTNDYLENSDNITVAVSSPDGTSSSEASINVTAVQPRISFYRNDSLQGTIWEQALTDGHKISGDEIVVATPYFLAPKELLSSSLVWSWYINGSLTNNTLNFKPNWLPIKVEGGSTGTSDIELDIENKDQFLETASKGINVQF